MRNFNGVPKDHFHLFLKECEWRFNSSDPKSQLKQLNQWVKVKLASYLGQTLILLLLLTACEKQDKLPQNTNETVADKLLEKIANERWFTKQQLIAGKQVFAGNCAVCHGEGAKGTVADWKQRLSNGKYPPPPLDGSAHAWHHSLSVLRRSINEGGQQIGGTMPAMKNKLNEVQITNVLAYITSLWPDETYQRWAKINH